MEDHDKVEYKIRLKHFCASLIEQRKEMARLSVENAREITNLEEKSTVGDKYETARAMGQLEQDMYSRQLAENMKELADLQTVDAGRIYKDVEPGGFVRCGDLNFFIAAGLGKHIFEGEQIVFLSPHAPLARTLLLKKAGEEFHFHDKVFRIVELF
jgi:transcription elongation GreA/GreB family factor